MKDRPKIRLFNVINGILFILISIIMLIPIYKVLVDSFDLTTAYGMRLWPKQFGLAVQPDAVSSAFDLSRNHTCWYLPWSGTFHSGCLCTDSVGYAGKNLLCKLLTVHHDLQRWYDPDLLGYEELGTDQQPCRCCFTSGNQYLQPRFDEKLLRGYSAELV